jgi:hypothetical protein
MSFRHVFGYSMLGLSGCGGGCEPSGAPVDSACASCRSARLGNLWCEKCGIGYVASTPMRSRALFEALDAHGHSLVLDAIRCDTCRAAIPVDGYCRACRIGWFEGQAYFSRLTHVIGKVQVLKDDAMACEVCVQNARKCGWCASCQRGMIGNFAIHDRKEFDAGRRGYDIMLIAIEASGRCETCALAIITDTPCPVCRITYKDGRPVPADTGKRS